MSNVTKASLVLAVLVTLVAPACGGEAGGGGGPSAPSSGAKHPLLNNPAPPLVADSVNGMGKVDVAQWKGKVVLVDFWATWCQPCKKSFPKLEELRVKYEPSGFAIVAVSEDDEGKEISSFGTTYGVRFPLVWDKDKSVAGKWKPPTMPSSFIVDKKGVVRFVHLGYHEGEEKEIELELKSLL